MMELTINGQVYQFNFGMGFLREANKTIIETNNAGAKRNAGASYMIAGLYDGNTEDLVNILDLANKGQDPRVTKQQLDNYIDDPNTEVDELFERTLDFLRKANATRKTVKKLEERIEEAKANRN